MRLDLDPGVFIALVVIAALLFLMARTLRRMGKQYPRAWLWYIDDWLIPVVAVIGLFAVLTFGGR